MDVRVGLWRKPSAEELMLFNCGVGEDSSKSFGLQGDPTSPSRRRSALGFFGRNDAKAETPVLWPPHAKSWLLGKDSVAGRDWGQEKKGMTEDEMAGWHHWLDERESQWTPGVGDRQGGLACCDSWGHKESDTTERLIWSDIYIYMCVCVCVCVYACMLNHFSHVQLCNLMDWSPPSFSVHEILQTRILEWENALLQGIFLTEGSNLHLL